MFHYFESQEARRAFGGSAFIEIQSPKQLIKIIDKIEKQKPLDYAVLLEWLKKGINRNGIYILGI